MATVINNPGTNSTEDSGSNMVLAVVLIVVILGAIVLFFVYGLPMIQNYSNPNPATTNINVTIPTTTTPPPATTPAK